MSLNCKHKLFNVEGLLGSKTKPDIIFLDLDPNAVTYRKVSRNPLEKIVTEKLIGRTKGDPLTVFLDLSTGPLNNMKVEEFLKNHGDDIKKGVLNVCLLNSLAKFPTMGNDKYTRTSPTVF